MSHPRVVLSEDWKAIVKYSRRMKSSLNKRAFAHRLMARCKAQMLLQTSSN